MPKAPSSQRRGARATAQHRPLGQEIREDEIVSRFGRVRAPTQRHKKSKLEHDEGEDNSAPGSSLKITGSRTGTSFVDPKLSRNILRLARQQQEEIEREEAELEADDDDETPSAVRPLEASFRDMEELEDEDDELSLIHI